MSPKLVHYLRSERRRKGLSQADVAALLGGRWKGRVSRYERGAMPPVDVALEYEAIFGEPISKFFGGAFERATLDVRRRAQELLRNDSGPDTPRRWRRRQTLERIAG